MGKKNLTNLLEVLSWLKKNNFNIILLDINMPEMKGFGFDKNIKEKAKIILCSNIRDIIIDEISKQLPVTEQQPNFMMITGPGRYNRIKINFSDILFITANKNHVVIHLEKETKDAFMSMKEIEVLLPPKQFARVHISYIICIDKIARLDRTTVLLKNCTKTIPIGPTFRENLLNMLNISDDF